MEIIYSSTLGGDAIIEPVDEGDIYHGITSTARELYVRHNLNNNITSCKFYIAPISEEEYVGSFSPEDDFRRLLEWGDALTSDTFGGFQLNMDKAGGFITWPTVSSKSGTNYNTFRTGVGDSITNGIELSTAMGLSIAGVIPPGVSNDISFKVRIKTPNNEYDRLGIRQVDLKISCSYTV
jgi:hypothetical protein